MPADHARVKELFFEAMDLPEEEVGPWLREATTGDRELYEAVAELLDFHDDTPLFGATDPAPDAEAAPPADPVGLEGAVLDHRYVVGRFVAEGGFAFVYRAEETATGEPVAIKLFKEVDPEERQRLEAAFAREAELLATLADRDPTIVRAHALTRWTAPQGQELLVQVLEWLDGHELSAAPGGQPLAAVLATLDPIARALATPHAAGIAHRDIKPGNLFVQRGVPGRKGRLRLLDFGIAKVAHDRARGFASTATASSAFTLHYAAPEQLLNRPTGPWTDVYALAVVVVELLAGRHPYAEQGSLETMMVLADPQRRPTPRSLGLEVQDAVESVLLEALDVEPEARPSMDDFWAALAAAAHP